METIGLIDGMSWLLTMEIDCLLSALRGGPIRMEMKS